MLKEIHDKVGYEKNLFLLLNAFILIAYGGLSFTFVIPWTDGFSHYSFVMYLFLCFIASNIYLGVFQHGHRIKVFLNALLLHSLGLLWRVLLEWGEYGISKFLTPPLIIGYLLAVPLIITICYVVIERLQKEQLNAK